MKNKKILTLTAIIALSTTTLAFANEIKMVEKNGQDYVPFKKLVKKLGGEVKENKEELNISVNSKEVIIQNDSSFAKVNEKHYPLESKEINGYKVPVDKNPLFENKEVYVSPEFLKNSNLLSFDIEDGKLIIDNKIEKETISTVKEESKKETVQNNSKVENEEINTETQQKPQTTVKPNRPIRPSSNQNNNSNNSNTSTSNKPNNDQNNSSNNNDSNNNSNNGSSEDNTNSEDNSNNSQENDSQVSPAE